MGECKHIVPVYVSFSLYLRQLSIVPHARTILTSDQSKRKLRLQASITPQINARRFTTRHSSGTNVDKSFDIIKRTPRLSQLKFAISNRSIDPACFQIPVCAIRLIVSLSLSLSLEHINFV